MLRTVLLRERWRHALRKSAMTIRPGMASRGVHSIPNRSAKGANSSGPNEKPSVPPVMCTDMASPGRVPPSRCASAAAGGWKAAPPSPPTNRMSASHVVVGARPMRLEHRTGEDRPDHHQDARTPRVRKAAETHLRHRRRNLVQHRQRAGRGEARAESGMRSGSSGA